MAVTDETIDAYRDAWGGDARERKLAKRRHPAMIVDGAGLKKPALRGKHRASTPPSKRKP